MSNRFVNSGILLFIDLIVTSAGNWIFWIVISKLTTTTDIGQSTTILGLIITISTLAQLGLEYPILKNSHGNRTSVLGSTLVLELAITAMFIPAMYYTISTFYEESFANFALIATIILVSYSIGFVFRYIMISVSYIRSIFIIDLAGTASRLLSGFVLVSFEHGVSGILIAFLLQNIMMNIMMFATIRKSFRFSIGSIDYLRKIFYQGAINIPSKLSKTIVISLSVVLLASFGVNDSEIGIFYISLMLSLIAGGLAASIAFTVIPESSTSDKDLSYKGIRIGLSLTAPIIAGLLSGSEAILSIIGSEYLEGRYALLVLSLSVIPYSIVVNAISRFNNLEMHKNIVVAGVVEMVVFLVSFWILVPTYGILGAAIAILLGFLFAAAPCGIWIGKSLIRPLTFACVAISSGVLPAYGVTLLMGTQTVYSIIIASIASLITIVAFKGTSISELIGIVKGVVGIRK